MSLLFTESFQSCSDSAFVYSSLFTKCALNCRLWKSSMVDVLSTVDMAMSVVR